MSLGAWAMLTIFSAILYGGALYYTCVGYGVDLGRLLDRFGLGIVNRTWKRGPQGRIIVIGGTILFLLAIEALLIGGGGGPDAPDGQPDGEWLPVSENLVVNGYTGEGTADDATPDLGGVIARAANLTLRWNDNDMDDNLPGTILRQNEPDRFRLIVYLPTGEELSGEATSDAASTAGIINLEVLWMAGQLDVDWIIEVECVEAGDLTSRFRTIAQDAGNDWTLEIQYSYLEWAVPT
jgi:hypothetical protein